ncbi:NapC/NirT family cytochrome c [bacterium]|nr:NapC/NirT family cytochrome c [bacterium]
MEDEKKKPDKPQKPRRRLKLLTLGFLLGVAFVAVSAWGVSWSSSTDFCMSCHEMRVVAEQGWMHSKHFENKSGVVAQCADCHIPPELFPKLWVKTRDGVKDVWAHHFGESDPSKMDWDALAKSARASISDSACRRCHANLTPRGMQVKGLIAHRENERLEEKKRCVECHEQEFHGRFRDFLSGPVSGAENDQ